jgi:glycosyltransferase involved in cell wall biosynthesis
MRILAIWPAAPLWHRDLALNVFFLRRMGHSAVLVADERFRPTQSDNRPIEFVNWNDLSADSWWRSHTFDAVILGLFGATKYSAVRAAALRNCKRVIERLDTDGVMAPMISRGAYFDAYWTHYADHGTILQRAFAPAIAALRMIVLSAMPSLLFGKLAAQLAAVPVVTAPLPLSAKRVQSFIRAYADVAREISFVPFAIDTSVFRFDPQFPKKNIVTTIGRWNSRQKDVGLTLKTLNAFLIEHSDWNAVIIGPGLAPKQLDRRCLSRVTLGAELLPNEIASIMQEAKIYFLASRQEGASLSCSEALVMGCSVVGPVDVACVAFNASANSGTVATRRGVASLVTALHREAILWNTGERDPQQIAHHWLQLHDGTIATQRYVNLFNRMQT